MIILHSCTMIIVDVSYPIGIMFNEIEGGQSGRRRSLGKQRGLEGRAGFQWLGSWLGGDSQCILGGDPISGDCYGWMDM